MHFRLCDFALDLVQNAVEAGASFIALQMLEGKDQLLLIIEDDGCGMDAETCARALDPFYSNGSKHRARSVGLGLSFVKQALDSTGGVFILDSEKGKGTKLTCSFDLAHVDTPPLGDVVSLILQSMMLPGTFELKVLRSKESVRGKDQYELSRSELQDILGDFGRSDSLIMLRQFVRSQEYDIK